MRNSFVLLALLLLPASQSFAQEDRCRERVTVGFGETRADIAIRCGITVEALDRQNPGLGTDPRAGTSIAVPRSVLPSFERRSDTRRYFVPVPTPPKADPRHQNN